MLNPEIINKNIWNRLTKIHQQNRASGAYLFIGSEKLGKFDLALDFIELGEGFENKRKLIEAGLHSDVIIVKPEIEEKKGKIKEKQISIEQIQEALKEFSYFPQESQNKFLLINGVDKLTLSAANSLLKTIEELGENSVVILTASGEGRVLETIKSRCQKIYFNLKTEEEIKNFIEARNTDLNIDFLPKADLKNTDLINDVVFLSRGRLKEAERLLKDEDYRKNRMEKLDVFRKALKGDLTTGFKIANEDTKDKRILEEYLMDWIYYLNSFLKQNVFEDKDLRVQKKVFQILKQLNEAQEILSSNKNVNSRVLLENFFVQIK